VGDSIEERTVVNRDGFGSMSQVVTSEENQINGDEGGMNEKAGEGEDAEKPMKKRERREPVSVEHGEGKSLFPFARVQRVMKADKVGLPYFTLFSLFTR
jgi:hypothetical protein